MQRGNKRKQSFTKKGTEKPAWQYMLYGLGLAWVITLAGLLITACLIYFGWLGSGAGVVAFAAKAIMILSMAAGGIYVLKKTSGKERIWALIMLIGYLAVRFLLSSILTFL